jgi:DNA helicase-2/ATP-dependent DNA helicase PcrA
MDPKKHPEYAQEAEKLANTISTIQHELEQLAPPIEGYGADQRAARLVRQAMLERLEKLKNARSEPYFGRVDWLPLDSNQVDIFYVAKQELSALNIYSWQETLPGDLFYTGRSSRERGKQLLKRRFQIDDDLLKDIGDDFVARERAQLTSFPVMTIPSDEIHADDLLISLLAEHREGLMHDIVATIQEEQYRLISSPLERVLVIQGVAGSGKTSIALHRLSYLLYPRDGKRKLEYQSVLYLAPNPIFLHYVGQVLPELGDRGVPQMTFDDWLVGRLGEKLDYEPEEDSLETLLSRAIEEPVRIMHYRNARNKGSLKMARLLDRFVQNTAEEFIESLGELEVSVPIGRKDGRGREKAIVCRYSAEQNRERFYQVRDSAPSPLALRPWIERFQDGLIRAVLYDARQQVRTTDVDWESVERKGRTSISAQINEYLRAWRQDGDQESSLGRSLNAFIAYRRLLRSPELLHRMGDGIFDRWQLELMHQDAPKQGTPFRFSDLSALLYLHLLIEGTPRSEMLEHVVVDEAQDITPLQFEVIRRLSSNQSFTIMGDLAQGIYADHGLESWTELNAIFGEESIESTVMQRSYRSTQPIMEYTNAMLARIGAASQLMAVPTGAFRPRAERMAIRKQRRPN